MPASVRQAPAVPSPLPSFEMQASWPARCVSAPSGPAAAGTAVNRTALSAAATTATRRRVTMDSLPVRVGGSLTATPPGSVAPSGCPRFERPGLAIGSPRHYPRRMAAPVTLLMWFQLRSPDLAGDFEALMTGDRDIVRGSLDTVGKWHLTQPTDVPGQAIGQADYVLIAEIVEVDRFEQQASEHVQRLADDLDHLVSSRGMLIVRPIL